MNIGNVGPYPGASQVVGGSTLPSTPTFRQIFCKSGSSSGLYVCVTNGAWVGPFSTGSGITGLTTNTIPKATGSTTIGDSSVTDTGSAVNITSESFGLTGNISSGGIFGTSGIRYKNVPGTLTDTTSSGTVATNYTNVFGANTLAASSATTITNDFNTYFKDPVAGSNVTLTNKWALGADSVKIGTSNQLTVSNAGVLSATSPVFVTPTLGAASATSITLGTSGNLFGGTNTVRQVNTSSAQSFEVYSTSDSNTSPTNYVKMFIQGDRIEQKQGGSGTLSDVRMGISGNGAGSGNFNLIFETDATDRWKISGTGNLLAATDNSYNVGASDANRPASVFPAAPSITKASGTGITLNDSGELRDVVYKITLTQAAFSAAATTADATIATLPAKTQLTGIWADVTQVFSGGAVSAATLTCGKTAGGAEYLASFDIKTATLQRGLVDADLGTSINRANAVQGGDMPSWSATTAIQCRLTTVTANTNALTQGSITFYLRTTRLP